MMINPKIIASVLIVEYLTMAAGYIQARDWSRAAYWTGATIITISVTAW